MNVLFGKYLPRLGLRSDLVALREGGSGESRPWGGGKALLAAAPTGRIGQHVVRFTHAVKHMLGARRHAYDAIQVRDLPLTAATGLLIGKVLGVPFFYWMSYPIPEGEIARARARGLSSGLLKYLHPMISGQLGRLALRWIVLPHAEHVFVQSQTMKQEVEAMGIDGRRVTPVPMGVDIDQLEEHPPVAVQDDRLAGRRVIAYLGTLDRPRQIEKLFAMLAILRQSVPDVVLVLVGDTSDADYRRQLLSVADELGVQDAFVFTGWLPMAEGWRFLRSAELGLSPFPRGRLLDSASPTKVAEYLALCLPVVCNDNPDQAFLVESSGAGLCVEYTPEAFAQAVGRLLSLDAGERQAMGARGAAFIRQRRAYGVIAAELAERYRQVIASGAAGGAVHA